MQGANENMLYLTRQISNEKVDVFYQRAYFYELKNIL
jgi:hypothetical protein